MANKINCFVCILFVVLCVLESMGSPIDTSGGAIDVSKFCIGEIHLFEFSKQYICQTFDKKGSMQEISDGKKSTKRLNTDITGFWGSLGN